MTPRQTRIVGGLSAAALFFVAGCSDFLLSGTDFRPEAVGQEGKVALVIDSTLWQGAVGDKLRETISAPIGTLPSREPVFEIDVINLDSRLALDAAKARKSVLFVAAIRDTVSTESRFVRSILSAEAVQAIVGGESAVVPRENVWRQRQQVFYVLAPTEEDLVAVIDDGADDVIYQLNEATRQRTHRDMFDIGRQRNIEEYLMDHHGFAVHGQHDYVVAVDTNQFVWMRRTLSDTWRSLFVYYEEHADPSRLTPEWITNTRDALTMQHIQGSLGGWVEIDRRQPLDSEEINFKDRFAFEVRGLWHMVGKENGTKFPFGMGGPFLTYAFYDEPTQRLYLVDGMVFAPNFPKREFLRQLEVIAYTFRTRLDTEKSSEA